jgi:hypothetical protein
MTKKDNLKSIMAAERVGGHLASALNTIGGVWAVNKRSFLSISSNLKFPLRINHMTTFIQVLFEKFYLFLNQKP